MLAGRDPDPGFLDADDIGKREDPGDGFPLIEYFDTVFEQADPRSFGTECVKRGKNE